MISRCINIITSNIKGFEHNLCLKHIKDIALKNINIISTGVDKSHEDVIF